MLNIAKDSSSCFSILRPPPWNCAENVLMQGLSKGVKSTIPRHLLVALIPKASNVVHESTRRYYHAVEVGGN